MSSSMLNLLAESIKPFSVVETTHIQPTPQLRIPTPKFQLIPNVQSHRSNVPPAPLMNFELWKKIRRINKLDSTYISFPVKFVPEV